MRGKKEGYPSRISNEIGSERFQKKSTGKVGTHTWLFVCELQIVLLMKNWINLQHWWFTRKFDFMASNCELISNSCNSFHYSIHSFFFLSPSVSLFFITMIAFPSLFIPEAFHFFISLIKALIFFTLKFHLIEKKGFFPIYIFTWHSYDLVLYTCCLHQLDRIVLFISIVFRRPRANFTFDLN